MKISLTSLSAFILLVLFHPGCEQEIGKRPITEGPIVTEEAYPQLSFTRPVDFQHAGDNSDRVFVVEQRGIISVFQNDAEVEETTIFLDIEAQVEDDGNEEGLLGLAFHPDYENNGYFYVNYTASNPDRTVISRFRVSSSDQNKAEQSSETILLEFDQPFGNHNGGQVSFGPDGYLYIAVGDGGSGGDPEENGQNLETLLGTILRIDVDNTAGEKSYAIPTDNPFANNSEGYREEIYAYGLRNPWRFSFDPKNNRLWTADVGQNAYEEIDIIEKGGNYGWNVMEGFHCFEPSSDCDKDGLKLPIWEYGRSEGDVSVTGGFVYRGPAMSSLEGLYVYADYASGRVWTLDPSDLDNPVNTELLQASFQISSFGTDQDNELYICGFDGKIYRFAYE
ncbi:MAG: PQQ-dependent sugar dehydrogenase [Anditalea sp.]